MWHDNETTRDLIGFQRLADIIASFVADKNILPVTVGLFGDWGSGKSSTLGMVEAQLAQQDGVLALRFDGWLFEGYDDAKAALMTSILDHLTNHIKENQALWTKVEPRVMSLLRRINWFRAVGLAAKGILTLTSPAGATVVAGLTALDAINFLRQWAEDPDAFQKAVGALIKDESTTSEDMHESIREFRSEFDSLIQEAEVATLVVLIDDLDRCLPESIVSTLEAIKLFLSVPGTAFVIAADERIVRHAIARRYPREDYQEFDIAQEYLDKLVQIPCVIPPMDDVETETYIYLLFAERLLDPEAFDKLCDTVRQNRKNPALSQPLNYGIARGCIGEEARKLEEDFALAERIAPILARHLGGNPRLVKRFLNTFALRIRLSEFEGIQLDHGILAKLMVLERFHEDRFNDIYVWQAEQDGIPEEIAKLESAVSSPEGETDTEDEAYRRIWLDDPDLRAWLQMEPRLGGRNLAPYFYLARESLRVKAAGVRRLSQEQQELFASLQAPSKAVRQKAAEQLATMPDDQILTVYDALWVRVAANPKGSTALDGLIELAYRHEGSARRLLENLSGLSPANISRKIVPSIGMIDQHHPGLTDEVSKQLLVWVESGQSALSKAAKAVLKSKGKM